MLLGAVAGQAVATGCLPCAFGGLCFPDAGEPFECGPSQAECTPSGGIALFNSKGPDAPAYWILFARNRGARSLGVLAGRLRVWADYNFPRPNVPTLPATCRGADRICFGRNARFRGVVVGDHLSGKARYPGGATCDFSATLRFGLGDAAPNSYVCRSPAGDLLSTGPLQVQVLRLFGCKREHRPSQP